MIPRVAEIIDNVRQLRNVIPCGIKPYEVKKVAVILTGSRGGSSLLFSVLKKHPQISALQGEDEPYWTLSRNGFGFTSDSDAFTEVNNPMQFLDDVFDELDEEDFYAMWFKRLQLQFPERHLSLDYLAPDNVPFWLKKHLIDGHYDLPGVTRRPFMERYKIEEPPFIVPELPATRDPNSCLLIKTPQNAYRIGVFEKLFPNAEVKYIHLTRGFAQSVNGLMDGWASEFGFHAHWIPEFGWWKFDLPPDWQTVRNEPLHHICAFQWWSAHNAILESGVPTLRVKFEDLLTYPADTTDRIFDYLDLRSVGVGVDLDRPVMATHPPRPFRWKDRASYINDLRIRPEISAMMRNLHYSMESKTWA